MTKRDILSVTFKILGVVYVMKMIASLPLIVTVVSAFCQRHSSELLEGINLSWCLGATIAYPILACIMACVLLRWGDLIAEKLIRVDTTLSVPDISQWQKPIFLLSLRIVGLVCVVKGIPNVVHALVSLSFRGLRTVSPVMLLILGAYLLLGGKHLVKFAFREREE